MISGENLAVNQTDIEHGVDAGECSFVVHGLCGSEFADMTYDQKVRYAVRYFDTGGKAMYYGHERRPQSIYHNPSLFPGMFPREHYMCLLRIVYFLEALS